MESKAIMKAATPDEEFADSVAQEIRNEALNLWLKAVEESGNDFQDTIKLSPAGLPEISYEWRSMGGLEGLGVYSFRYIPVGVIKNIVIDVSDACDEPDIKKNFKDDDERKAAIKNMSVSVLMAILVNLPFRVGDSIGEMYQDAILSAQVKLFSIGEDQFDRLINCRIFLKLTENQRRAERRKRLADLMSTFSNVSVPSGRGRPPEWTKVKLEKAAAREVSAFQKRSYRAPTLRDVADLLNKRYPGRKPFTPDSLRMLLKAHGIVWMALKKRR
jgi:hypothetical protein